MGRDGFGSEEVVGDAVELAAEGTVDGTRGVNERVIAWTLELMSVNVPLVLFNAGYCRV